MWKWNLKRNSTYMSHRIKIEAVASTCTLHSPTHAGSIFGLTCEPNTCNIPTHDTSITLHSKSNRITIYRWNYTSEKPYLWMWSHTSKLLLIGHSAWLLAALFNCSSTGKKESPLWNSELWSITTIWSLLCTLMLLHVYPSNSSGRVQPLVSTVRSTDTMGQNHKEVRLYMYFLS